MSSILERLTGRQGRPWLLLFLTPIGYLVGGRALALYDPHSKLGLSVTRDEAVAIARRFAASKGLGADSRSEVHLGIDNDFRKYAARNPAAIRLVQPFTRAVTVYVTFFLPKNRATVVLAPDGRIVGWDLGTTDHRTAATTRLAAADAARKALEEELGPAEASKFQVEGSGRDKEGREIFTSRRRFAELPDLSVRSDITVRNHEVTAIARQVELDPGVDPQKRSIPRLVIIIGAFLFMAGYVLFRFVRRMREQEVPVARAVVIAIAVAVLFSFLSGVLTDNFGRTTTEGDASGVLIAIVFGMILVGVAVGLTWGACEGDVREVYPTKLASFDALLGGKAYSRVVAGSIVTGIAFGAICIAGSGLGAFLTRNGWRTLDEATVIMAHAPVVTVLVSALVGIPLLAGFGLLIPISLLSGRIRSRLWLGVMAAVLLCLVQSVIAMGDSSPKLPGIVATIVSISVTVLPFFAADLMAMFVANVFAACAAYAVYMLSQPAAGFHAAGMEVIAVLLLISAAAAATALWGPQLVGAGLAPRYAGNIAQRLSLQAERAASRQAQLRILPRQLPQSALVSIAAECRSIDADSSDYYDIIELGGGRLGVLLASCAAPGLSAALSITMLKGLMTSYAQRWSSPFDLLARVRSRLTGVFGNDLQLSVFYAVLDTVERTLDVAQLGNAPLLMALGPARSSRVVVPDQRRADGEGPLRIAEGCAALGDSESIVISNGRLDQIQPHGISVAPAGSTSAILGALFGRSGVAAPSPERQNDFSAIVISLASPMAAMP